MQDVYRVCVEAMASGLLIKGVSGTVAPHIRTHTHTPTHRYGTSTRLVSSSPLHLMLW